MLLDVTPLGTGASDELVWKNCSNLPLQNDWRVHVNKPFVISPPTCFSSPIPNHALWNHPPRIRVFFLPRSCSFGPQSLSQHPVHPNGSTLMSSGLWRRVPLYLLPSVSSPYTRPCALWIQKPEEAWPPPGGVKWMERAGQNVFRAHAWVLLSWSLESDSWTLCRPQSSSSVPNPKSLPPLKKNRLKVVVYTIQDLCKSKILKLFLNCTMLKTAYKRVKHITAR